ncbi:hypothetical protein ABTQ23_19110, partial [Celerinatantimonas sp. MCCC 1A17872]
MDSKIKIEIEVEKGIEGANRLAKKSAIQKGTAGDILNDRHKKTPSIRTGSDSKPGSDLLS